MNQGLELDPIATFIFPNNINSSDLDYETHKNQDMHIYGSLVFTNISRVEVRDELMAQI